MSTENTHSEQPYPVVSHDAGTKKDEDSKHGKDEVEGALMVDKTEEEVKEDEQEKELEEDEEDENEDEDEDEYQQKKNVLEVEKREWETIYSRPYNPKDDSDIKKEFTELHNVPLNVNYCYGGQIAAAPISSISVEGVGEFTFPLAEESLLRLRAHAKKAPFGKGQETLHDTKVRDAWQIEALDIFFASEPSFLTRNIHLLARQALKQHLNIDADKMGVEAHLYKLLIYEEGGHFLPHRDSEKEPGMFATYLMQLPTTMGYTGGSLVIKHEDTSTNSKTEYDFAKESTNGNTFHEIAFYADCEHELLPIVSGWRVVLAFNLIWKKNHPDMTSNQMMVLPSGIYRSINTFNQADILVDRWEREGITKQKFIVFPLKHMYTYSSLSFSSLKGEDSVFAQALMHTGKLQLSLFLIKKYKRVMYSYDRDGTDSEEENRPIIEYECCWHRSSICNENSVYAFNFNTDVVGYRSEKSIFHPKADPNDSKEIDYTGNESTGCERWYYKALLLATPKSFVPTIELEQKIDSFLTRIQKCFLINKEHMKVQFNDEAMCKQLLLMLYPEQLQRAPESYLPMLAVASYASGMMDMFEAIINRIQSSYILLENGFNQMVYLMHILGWENKMKQLVLHDIWNNRSDKYYNSKYAYYQLVTYLKKHSNMLQIAQEIDEYLEDQELLQKEVDINVQVFFNRIYNQIQWNSSEEQKVEEIVTILNPQELTRLLLKALPTIPTIPKNKRKNIWMLITIVVSFMQSPQSINQNIEQVFEVLWKAFRVASKTISWNPYDQIASKKLTFNYLLFYLVKTLSWEDRMKSIVQYMWNQENSYASISCIALLQLLAKDDVHEENVLHDLISMMLPTIVAYFKSNSSLHTSFMVEKYSEVIYMALQRNIDVELIFEELKDACSMKGESEVFRWFWKHLTSYCHSNQLEKPIWQELIDILDTRLKALERFSKNTKDNWRYPNPPPVPHNYSKRMYSEYTLYEDVGNFLKSDDIDFMLPADRFAKVSDAHSYIYWLGKRIEGIKATLVGHSSTAQVKITKVLPYRDKNYCTRQFLMRFREMQTTKQSFQSKIDKLTNKESSSMAVK